MNEFIKENKKISSEKLLKSYNENISYLDSTINRIKSNGKSQRETTKDLCLLFGNHASLTKTIMVRYLQLSDITNQKINYMTIPELFVKFKKCITNDTQMPCPLTTELHMISFDLRNKLAHNINQSDYMENVISQSGVKKMLNFLTKLSDESKEIEHCFNLKLEQSKNYKKDNDNSQEREVNHHHFMGIRY